MKKIIVTGDAGFIGSMLIKKLNQEGIDDILIVDALAKSDKWKNLVSLSYADYLHKDLFIKKVINRSLDFKPDAVIHRNRPQSDDTGSINRASSIIWVG